MAKTSTKAKDENDQVPGVATAEENAKLEHSDETAPQTTRDDALDVGVPMLQGSPDEPVGPEDALGEGPKRGDYRERIIGIPTETVPVPGGSKPIYAGEDGKQYDEPGEGRVIVDYTPNAVLVDQRKRAEDIGEVEGEKGGVTTG